MQERRLGTGGGRRSVAAILRTAVAGRAPVARVPPVVGLSEDDRRRRRWRTVARRHVRAGQEYDAAVAHAAVHAVTSNVRRDLRTADGSHQIRTSRLR